MSRYADPAARRWLVGVELANYRKQSGLSLTEVSEATGITKPKLGHMETGRYQQHPDDVTAVLRACGTPERDVNRLAALAGRSDGKTWWAPWARVLPDWLKTYVGLEGLAEGEFTFEPLLIPGLLQTEEYAEAITRSTGFVRADHIERFASFRVARARRLTEPEPLRLHTVIGEAALRLRVGTPDLRRSQLEHLAKIGELPSVTIQVLRPDDGPHQAAAVGQFMVLEFPEVRPIVFTELLDSAVYVHDPDKVRTYTWVAENLRQVALGPAESLALIQSLVDSTT